MFDLLFVIVPIFIFITFIFTFAMILSPKLRGKMMSRQIESLKHMTEYSKEDLETINKNLSEVAINSKSSILRNNKSVLKEMADIEADISENSIMRKTRAVKEGLFGSENSKYCQSCGETLDSDSKFCKRCGQKLQ